MLQTLPVGYPGTTLNFVPMVRPNGDRRKSPESSCENGGCEYSVTSDTVGSHEEDCMDQKMYGPSVGSLHLNSDQVTSIALEAEEKQPVSNKNALALESVTYCEAFYEPSQFVESLDESNDSHSAKNKERVKRKRHDGRTKRSRQQADAMEMDGKSVDSAVGHIRKPVLPSEAKYVGSKVTKFLPGHGEFTELELRNLLEGNDKRFVTVINPWTLNGCVGTRDIEFEQYADSAAVQGRFKFGNLAVTTRVVGPYLNNEDRVLAMSDCRTVAIVQKLEGMARPYIQLDPIYFAGVLYPVVGGPKERVRLIVRTLVNRHITSRYVFDFEISARYVEAEFKRYYKPYSDLKGDIQEILFEDWFIYKLSKHQKTKYSKWNEISKARIEAYCATKGMSVDALFHKTAVNYVALFAAKVALSLTVGYVMSYFKKVRNYAPAATLATSAMLVGPQTFDLAYDGWTTTLTKDALKIMDPKPIFAPASKIVIEKTCASQLPQDYPPVRDGSNYHYTEVVPTEKQLRPVEVYGTITNSKVVYPASTIANVNDALRKRMLFERTTDPVLLNEFMLFAFNWIDKLPDMFPEPLDNEVWLKQQYGGKAPQYIKFIGEPVSREWVTWDVFNKKEGYLGKEDSDFKCRCICSASFVLLANLGSYFASVGKCVADLFNKNTDRYYCTKNTPVDVGEFGEKIGKYRFKYEDDFGNFDGSQDKKFKEIDKYFLTHKCHNKPECLEDYLEIYGRDYVRTKDGSVSAELDGQWPSGHPLTSVMNTIKNFIIHDFLFSKLAPQAKLIMMGLGDDNVLGATDSVNPDEANSLLSKLGLSAKLIERNDLDQISFCSGFFWNVGGRYVYGSDPFRILSKFGWNHNNHHHKLFKRLLYGSAKSMLPIAGHVPIVGAFLRALVVDGDSKKVKAFYDNSTTNPYRIQGGPCLYPTDETYEQFSMLYGMPIDAILAIESEMSKLTLNSLPGEFVGDWLRVEPCLEPHKYTVSDDIPIPTEYELLKKIDTSLLSDDVIMVEVSPLLEEVDKLKGAKTFSQAMKNAESLARYEVANGSPEYMISVHKFFTALSWIHLPLGVSVHRRWNELSVLFGQWPAASKKGNTPKVKPRRQVQKDPNLTAALDPYIAASLTPFDPGAVGARVPDSEHYPTVAKTRVVSTSITVDANGYGALVVRADQYNVYATPASISAGGTVTWHTATVVAGTDIGDSLSSEFPLVRIVGGGIAADYESKVDDVAGMFSVAGFPDLYSTAELTYTSFPVDRTDIRLLHEFDEITLSQLSRKGTYHRPFRRLGKESYLYKYNTGSAVKVSGLANGDPKGIATSGWETLMLYVSGATAGAVIDVHIILHLEAIMAGNYTRIDDRSDVQDYKPILKEAIEKIHSHVTSYHGDNHHNTVKKLLRDVTGTAFDVAKGMLISGTKKALGKLIPYLAKGIGMLLLA